MIPSRTFLLLSFIFVLVSTFASAADKKCSLEEAYQAALNNSEAVKIAQEGVLQSGNRVDQAWSYIYPRVVGQGAYTRYNETLPPGGGPMLFQPLGQFQASVVLTQPLYTGGRTLAALRTAQAMRQAGVVSVSLAKQETILNVAEAYYGVLKAQKAVEISRHSLSRMEHHRAITAREAATRSTKANQSSLLRADSLVSMARIALVRADDGLKVVRERLGFLTKLPSDVVLTEPAHLAAPAETLDALQSAALRDRNELENARLNSRIAEENIAIVKGGHLPQVSAVAGATYTDSSPATAMDATVYYGGLRLEVPIFEGGLKQAELAEAHSRVRQADLSINLLQESIKSEVYDAYINLQTITSVLETARQQRVFAQGNYEAVEGLFSDGLLPSLSMIDAEQALTQAESEIANAEYDQQLSILLLKKSIGALGREDH